MTSKRDVVPGVGTTQKAPRVQKPRATKRTAQALPEDSDLRPRTEVGTASSGRGIDPAQLQQHMENLQNEVHAQTNAADLRRMAETAGQQKSPIDTTFLEAVVRELRNVARPASEDIATVAVPTDPAGPATGRPATVPSLVSQGLVNVLMQVRQTPTDLVEAKLDDLTGTLQLRANASTPESRQRYTLMACIQIAQDFEGLWDTQAAPLR